MSDRVCIRGCTLRGEHYAACPDFGRTDGDCKGCVESPARERTLVCDRCFSRMRRTLEQAPDIVALIRSKADPLKATAYDREKGSGVGTAEAPAPVSADLLDAGDAVIAILASWAGWTSSLPPGVGSDDAHEIAAESVSRVISTLEELTNHGENVLLLWADLVDIPDDPDAWSIGKALARWPMEERSFIASQPCPMDYCGLVAVRVTPPRRAGGPTWFQCQECDWETTDSGAKDEGDGFWTEVFTRRGQRG